MKSSITILALSAACQIQLAAAHTYIWSVYVNGVDQGTFNGIRTPAYNGPPPHGYANSPVKNLTSIDMRCNVMGDHVVKQTIKVAPGDNITMDWHHDDRSTKDEPIASSHKGPILIYLSPNPPTENSFVKIFEKGKYEEGSAPLQPGKWATTEDVAMNGGHMNVRVPAGLKAGNYLLRAEMIGLHEADANYLINPIRGAQFYPDCVQLEIIGDGTVELPEGVSFPGAYNYSDPGIVYDIYCSTKTKTTAPCTTTYPIPGPTVWSGAWAETPEPDLGPMSGVTKAAPTWNTWIEKSIVTSGTMDGQTMQVLGTSVYVASWPTVAAAAAATPTE